MNLARCQNGHFYDDDRFLECPFCHGMNDEAEKTLQKYDYWQFLEETDCLKVWYECPFCNSLFEAFVPFNVDLRDAVHCNNCDKAVSVYLRLLQKNSADNKTITIASREDEIIIVGRDKNAKLKLSDISTARRHAIFVYKKGIWCLSDTGALNGTYLNGRRLDAYKYIPLKSEDIISFSNKSTYQFID